MNDMDDINPAPDIENLEKQMEKGGFFTHSALSIHAERINRIESFLYGLADTLLESGQITEDQLQSRTTLVYREMKEKGESLSGGVMIRMDPEPPVPDASVECRQRMHICNGVCCRLSFPLSIAEIEGGKVKWELGKPYFVRKNHGGVCVHQTIDCRCGVYEHRPQVCRTYSCKKDERIWKDYDTMELNQEWIDENLKGENLRLLAIRMDRMDIPGTVETP